MNRKTPSKEEVKKFHASKEVQCNLTNNSLKDCENKNDEYRIDIRGNVNDLMIGPQVNYQGNNQVYNISSSPIPFNINFHGVTFILDPINSQEIILRNSEAIQYTKMSTNGFSWHSVQTECNEETRKDSYDQETVIKNLNKDIPQFSKIQKPSICKNGGDFYHWNPWVCSHSVLLRRGLQTYK